MVTPAAPSVVELDDQRALDAALTGAKAANLARCARAGLPVLPGFVVTTAGCGQLGDPSFESELRRVHDAFVGGDVDRGQGHGSAERTLVVRSSSTAEDLTTTSMAGQFRSVLDVEGWTAFRDAVDDVVASAANVDDGVVDAATTVEEGSGGVGGRPMAVLVQAQLDLAVGGVLFGVDPITGRRDHVVVEAVPARVDALVGGEVTAAHHVLTRHGRVVESAPPGAPPLDRRLRRRLARLARDAASALGPAQDVEWAVGHDGRLWLLQSRPVTAVAARRGPAHVFGPGPVAETFPAPLRRLEQDLWVEPLREGIDRALRVSGAVADSELDASPLLVTLGGRVAIDLELTGIATGDETFRRHYGPARIIRRLAGSWRIGRLRVALPRLVEVVVDAVDRDLAAIPPLDGLATPVLVDLVDRARRELATVHQYEVLAGMLLHGSPSGVPATLIALDALHEARDRGWSDGETLHRRPVVLCLTAPSLDPVELPTSPPHPVHEPCGLDDLDEREALRLRARWLQQLSAVAVGTLARRLADEGVLARPQLVRELTLAEVAVAVDGEVPDDLEARARVIDGPPLPSRFRLTASGGVVPVDGERHDGVGLPASGGRAVGVARRRVTPGAPRDGTILVVDHLEPSLAPLLPSIDGLVAETGSALSHLAILAREMGVPAVVGVTDARRRFPPGTPLVVDGDAGDVRAVDAAGSARPVEGTVP